MPLVLHNYFRSSASWRVRNALHWKGIDFDYVPVNLLKNEQFSEEYSKVNPRHLVPTLVDDGTMISESMAIVEYLEEKYPNKRKLLTGNAVDRAKIRALAYQITSNIQPIQNLRVLNHVSTNKEDQGKWADHWIKLGFSALEKDLGKTAGKYAYGNEVSLADICIVPQVFNAGRFGVSMDEFPIIKRVNEALLELPEFQKAHPSQQVDAPAK